MADREKVEGLIQNWIQNWILDNMHVIKDILIEKLRDEAFFRQVVTSVVNFLKEKSIQTENIIDDAWIALWEEAVEDDDVMSALHSAVLTTILGQVAARPTKIDWEKWGTIVNIVKEVIAFVVEAVKKLLEKE